MLLTIAVRITGSASISFVVGQPNERFRRRKRAESLRGIEEIDHQRDIDENTQQQNARNHVEIRRSTVHASASSLLHNGHLLIEYRFAFTYTGLPFKGYAPLLKDNRSMVDLSPLSRHLGEKKNRRRLDSTDAGLVTLLEGSGSGLHRSHHRSAVMSPVSRSWPPVMKALAMVASVAQSLPDGRLGRGQNQVDRLELLRRSWSRPRRP